MLASRMSNTWSLTSSDSGPSAGREVWVGLGRRIAQAAAGHVVARAVAGADQAARLEQVVGLEHGRCADPAALHRCGAPRAGGRRCFRAPLRIEASMSAARASYRFIVGCSSFGSTLSAPVNWCGSASVLSGPTGPHSTSCRISCARLRAVPLEFHRSWEWPPRRRRQADGASRHPAADRRGIRDGAAADRGAAGAGALRCRYMKLHIRLVVAGLLLVVAGHGGRRDAGHGAPSTIEPARGRLHRLPRPRGRERQRGLLPAAGGQAGRLPVTTSSLSFRDGRRFNSDMASIWCSTCRTTYLREMAEYFAGARSCPIRRFPPPATHRPNSSQRGQPARALQGDAARGIPGLRAVPRRGAHRRAAGHSGAAGAAAALPVVAARRLAHRASAMRCRPTAWPTSAGA